MDLLRVDHLYHAGSGWRSHWQYFHQIQSLLVSAAKANPTGPVSNFRSDCRSGGHLGDRLPESLYSNEFFGFNQVALQLMWNCQ